MSKEVLWIWTVQTLTDNTAAIEVVHGEAKARGHYPDTVYVSGRLTLVEETLTDRSKVLNLHLADHEGQ